MDKKLLERLTQTIESGATPYLFKETNMRQDYYWQLTAMTNLMILDELSNLRKDVQTLFSFFNNTTQNVIIDNKESSGGNSSKKRNPIKL